MGYGITNVWPKWIRRLYVRLGIRWRTKSREVTPRDASRTPRES